MDEYGPLLSDEENHHKSGRREFSVTEEDDREAGSAPVKERDDDISRVFSAEERIAAALMVLKRARAQGQGVAGFPETHAELYGEEGQRIVMEYMSRYSGIFTDRKQSYFYVAGNSQRRVDGYTKFASEIVKLMQSGVGPAVDGAAPAQVRQKYKRRRADRPIDIASEEGSQRAQDATPRKRVAVDDVRREASPTACGAQESHLAKRLLEPPYAIAVLIAAHMSKDEIVLPMALEAVARTYHVSSSCEGQGEWLKWLHSFPSLMDDILRFSSSLASRII